MAKNLEKIWKQVPADYYEKGISTNFFQFVWHNWKWIAMKKILETLNPEPVKILDVGCASGHITAKIVKLFTKAKVAGVDVYNQAVKLGQKIHPEVEFKIGDAHKLPFKNETFDLVTCIETLEHLKNPSKALAEIKRVLRPKAAVLIGQDTNNWQFKLVWFFWTKTRGHVWQHSHLNPLTPKLLENLLKKSGFKIKLRRFSQIGLEIFFLAFKI